MFIETEMYQPISCFSVAPVKCLVRDILRVRRKNNIHLELECQMFNGEARLTTPSSKSVIEKGSVRVLTTIHGGGLTAGV